MASSGDYTYNPSTFAIITGAMRLIGAIQSGEVPPAEEYEDALASLNGVIHAWQADGIHVWTQTVFELALKAGQHDYLIGIGSPDSIIDAVTQLPAPRPLKVKEGRFVVQSGGEIHPLIPMSRQDYENLSHKQFPTGVPTQYLYDPQLPYGIMWIYPAPAVDGIARFNGQRPLQAFDTQRDTADVPQEWISALRFALAVELAPEYDVPAERLKIIKELADEKLTSVKNWDTEPQGTSTLSYSQTVYQLISGALRLCGGCGPQDVPTLGLVNNGLHALNLMVKSWQAMGMHVWTQTEIDVPLEAGKNFYQIGIGSPDLPTTPRPLRMTGGRLVIVSGGEVVPLIPMSRWDYGNLSGKLTLPGPPTNYFYDPQIPYGLLWVYPAPDASGVARFVMQRQLSTFADLSATADFPDEWMAALRYNLALALWHEHTERRAVILKNPQFSDYAALKALADESLAIVKTWDSEPQGTSTLPFSQQVYQLISGALRLCGGCGAQDTPTIGLINNGFYSLNAMVQQWQGQGIRLWTQRDATMFLQPGQRSYRIGVGSPDHCCASDAWRQTFLTNVAPASAMTLTVNSTTGITAGDHIAVVLDAQPSQPSHYFWTLVASVSAPNTVTVAAPVPTQAASGARVITYTDDLVRPLKMPAARRIVYAGNYGTPTKIETPLAVYSRIDYSFQTNKDAPGQVTGFYFDPQLGFAEFHTWPTPGDADQAVQFTCQLPLSTYADLTTADNFPAEWQNAIRYCLAVELWPEHADRRAATKGDYNIQLLKGLADEKLMIAQAWDREPESVYFGLQRYSDVRNT